MNPKSRVRVYHENGKIEMNKIFAKMVENPFTEEYAFLQKLRGDNPTYTVTVREIKKNTAQEHYAGLTYEYMRNYITIAPIFDRLRLNSTTKYLASQVVRYNLKSY